MRGALIGLVFVWAFACTAAAGTGPQKGFDEAMGRFEALAEEGLRGRDPDAWRSLGRTLEDLSEKPAFERAAEAAYRAGLCFEKAQSLCRQPKRCDDRDHAEQLYERVAREHARSALADDALLRAGRSREIRGDVEGARVRYQRLLAEHPEGDGAPLAKSRLEGLGKETEVGLLRAWSGPGYTRIVVDLAGGTVFEPGLLPADERAGKTFRVLLDFPNARLGAACANCLPVGDGVVRQVRAARFSPTAVRVVLDLEAQASFRVFPLDAPSRVVVDVFRAPGVAQTAGAEKGSGLRIVVDPGHGGPDPGALGPGGLQEKGVVLALAKELARELRARLGCTVKLTREDDRAVSLEERTAIANAAGANLFVSIHANASRSSSANGIETYYLDRTSDRAARKLAVQENATGEAGISGIEHILTDVLLTSKVAESKRLAEAVQQALVAGVGASYGPVRDLGVKRAPFYVLTGAAMPAVLVETAFISHAEESKRLADPQYRSQSARALAQGVERFLGRQPAAASAVQATSGR